MTCEIQDENNAFTSRRISWAVMSMMVFVSMMMLVVVLTVVVVVMMVVVMPAG